MSEFAKNHIDTRVKLIFKRLEETRSKLAKFQEYIVKLEQKTNKKLQTFIEDVSQTTNDDLIINDSIDNLIHSATEELGEFCAAYLVETKRKQKELKESSKDEAVDLTICALSLYFAQGGTIEELIEVGNRKLNKWKNRLKT